MIPGEDIIHSPDTAAEVERLLADAARQEETLAAARGQGETPPHDFRSRTPLSARELRQLRSHEAAFAGAAGAQLSTLLRLDFALKLAAIEVMSFEKFSQGWDNPTHLTLFKTEPLRGVSVLHVPLCLATGIVDRLMGGAGAIPETVQELSEIERALLDQAIQVILVEWTAAWRKVRELKPVILGSESDGRFVQVAPPETNMLVLQLEASYGDCNEKLQIAFPFSSLEPVIAQLCQSAEVAPEPAPKPVTTAGILWNPVLDEVCIPVVARCPGPQLAARDILNLKVGDVLQLGPQFVQNVHVRLGEHDRFSARLGTVNAEWAVELAGKINH